MNKQFEVGKQYPSRDGVYMYTVVADLRNVPGWIGRYPLLVAAQEVKAIGWFNLGMTAEGKNDPERNSPMDMIHPKEKVTVYFFIESGSSVSSVNRDHLEFSHRAAAMLGKVSEIFSMTVEI